MQRSCVIKNILYKRSLHYWEVVIIGGGREFPMKTRGLE